MIESTWDFETAVKSPQKMKNSDGQNQKYMLEETVKALMGK